MNQQRQVVYSRRRKVLEGESVLEFFEDAIHGIAKNIIASFAENTEGGAEKLAQQLSTEFNQKIVLGEINLAEVESDAIAANVTKQVTEQYKAKKQGVGDEIMSKVESFIHLQIIDQSWKDHLRSMETLQDNVRLRGYGQRDPLQEYQMEAFNLFQALMIRIEDETTLALVRMPPPRVTVSEELEAKAPDESKMAFQHPAAQKPVAAKPEEEDGMIYHGSRSAPKAAPKVETFVREGDKVGRNDVCPCGSGKKYKKCHGKQGLESSPSM
jgi:preprotein translocase subunit SecA